jgi:DNA-binding transcriptional LysR family regulator
MELRHLKYFVAVAEEMHFARAAERLNITPPTLTHQIKALETILGVRLFNRSGNTGVALTRIGTQFLDEAKATLKQAARAELVVRQAGRGEMGTIEVGFILSAICGDVVTSYMSEFKGAHPRVVTTMRKMETFPQLRELTEGTLDIGFMRAPDRYPAGLTGFIIERQELWLAISKDHKLANHETVDPKELVGERFVGSLLTMEVGFWDNINHAMPSGESPHIVARAPDIISVLTLVGLGAGMSVVSGSLKQIAFPNVIYRKIAGPAKYADHVVVFRKNDESKVVKAFVAMLRKKIQNIC